MTAVLLYVLSKSLVAIPFVLIILGVRLATKSYSKVYVKILWITLFAELLLPALWRSGAVRCQWK